MPGEGPFSLQCRVTLQQDATYGNMVLSLMEVQMIRLLRVAVRCRVCCAFTGQLQ